MRRIVCAVVVWSLCCATASYANRDPNKCGRTVIHRALAKYKQGKRAYFTLPKGCPTFIVPPDFHTRPLNNGAGVGIYHNNHPDNWLAAVIPPTAHGIVTMQDGEKQLWRHGEFVGSLREEN